MLAILLIVVISVKQGIRPEECSFKDFPDLPPNNENDIGDETFYIVAILSEQSTVKNCGAIHIKGKFFVKMVNYISNSF